MNGLKHTWLIFFLDLVNSPKHKDYYCEEKYTRSPDKCFHIIIILYFLNSYYFVGGIENFSDNFFMASDISLGISFGGFPSMARVVFSMNNL